jgi:hypothetical protein
MVALGAALAVPSGASWADPGGDGSTGQIAISVTIPDDGTGDGPGGTTRDTLSNAQLIWGFNLETRGKSYYGACNFLMAGRPGADGNAGAAQEWEPGGWGQGLYHAESGNAKAINAAGAAVPFDRRCLDSSGQPVQYNAAKQSASTYTDTQIQLTGGTGWRDAESGQAHIEWQGTFTVVYYDGLTYFWVENPVLTIDAKGSATLSATGGGYGSPREGGAWGRHPDTAMVLATAPTTANANADEGALTSANGLTLKHAYAGRQINVPAGAPDQRLVDSNAPGAWPQSFVDFQGITGLHSYWYSSGSAIDYRKPPDPVYVSWDAASPVESPVVSAPGGGSTATSGWGGGLALPQAVAVSGQSQGGATGATDAGNPWGMRPDAVVAALAHKDLVPERDPYAGTSIAAQAAILTLLVSASFALIAWRRGWFRLQPKGIVS